MSIVSKLINNRVTRRIRPALDRFAMRNGVTLKLYNWMANRISNSARHALWEQSSKSAVNHSVKFAAQAWQVDDGVVRFQLPLRNDFAWLDWDAAIATLGHDVEVKALYRKLVLNARKHSKKMTFVDAGANYGFHSAYFAASGSEVYSFEPNPNCAPHFVALAKLNDWTTHWTTCGLGELESRLMLGFPPGEEWLGTCVSAAEKRADWTYIEVPIRTLDSMTLSKSGDIVLKIDTEGFELPVLRGAVNTIATRCSHVIFESLIKDASRGDIADFFLQNNLPIHTIGVNGELNHPLTKNDFVNSTDTNFCAARVRVIS